MDKVDHLAAVLEEIAADWYLFLGQLGVSDGTRSQILQQSIGQPNVAQYCLTKGLHHWVVSDKSPILMRRSLLCSTVTSSLRDRWPGKWRSLQFKH